MRGLLPSRAMDQHTPIIKVADLSRTFRVYTQKRGLLGGFLNLFSSAGHNVHAVDRISFTIARGEFVGYVGPNGAGKSTTIKMLSGILVPSGGELSVLGRSPHRQRRQHAAQIGVVFGQRTQLWWDLTPLDAYTLLARMYRVESAEAERRIRELSEWIEITDVLQTPVRKLSLGQRMRCDLVAALLHQPEVLFLDEPTIGLDVVAKQKVRSFLKEVNERKGVTILLTTHDLDDIERLCSRVMVIDHGRIVHDGNVASLRARFGNRRRVVVQLAREAALALPAGASLKQHEGARYEIDVELDQLSVPELMRHLLDRHEVLDLTVHEPDIEEVIHAIYGNGASA